MPADTLKTAWERSEAMVNRWRAVRAQHAAPLPSRGLGTGVRLTKWTSRLIIACLFLGCSVVQAQPQESIGQVAFLQGQATVQRAGQAQPMSLQVSSPVFQEDTIRTQEGSKIQLVLMDTTELSLGERGTMTLSSLVYAPQRHTHRGVVSVAQGIFRAVTKKVLPQTAFEVRTGTAVAAVRGTQWLGEVTPEATAIVVLQGEVVVTHVDPSIRGTSSLTQGLGTEVQGKTPPTPAKKWAEERVFKLLRATALP